MPGGPAAFYAASVSIINFGDEGDSGHRELEAIADSTPEEFANLEAAKELDRERWHKRLVRFLRLVERGPSASGKP